MILSHLSNVGRILILVILSIMSGVSWQVQSAAQAPVSLDVAAPELVGGPWLNTVKNQPLTLASRKGRVTVVEFWTFG